MDKILENMKKDLKDSDDFTNNKEHVSISKILNKYDEEMNDLDNEYLKTRIELLETIITNCLKLIEIESLYKVKKLSLSEKRNFYIFKKTKKQKRKKELVNNIVV